MDAPCIASGSDELRLNFGLAVIYPAFGAVGDRWPWWNPRIGAHHVIELRRSDNASGLADPGCPVSPSLHHHPRNPVRRYGWLSRQRQPSLGISRRYIVDVYQQPPGYLQPVVRE